MKWEETCNNLGELMTLLSKYNLMMDRERTEIIEYDQKVYVLIYPSKYAQENYLRVPSSTCGGNEIISIDHAILRALYGDYVCLQVVLKSSYGDKMKSELEKENVLATVCKHMWNNLGTDKIEEKLTFICGHGGSTSHDVAEAITKYMKCADYDVEDSLSNILEK